VIARDPAEIRTPADLAGKEIGVTGVPSDDAVLDTVLRSGGVDPSDVHPVTIGFNAVASLAAGKIDAATAFWNAEGVQLQQMGIPIREFRVDQFGAPRYPELVVATSADRLSGEHCPTALALVQGLEHGYLAMKHSPSGALDDLLASVPDLDRDSQQPQFDALLTGHAFSPRDLAEFIPTLSLQWAARWVQWARANGVISSSSSRDVADGFRVVTRADTCPLAR
jgi:ABC-type nitrate/sulfonate/bicarbonate transport system substrate-binding protein